MSLITKHQCSNGTTNFNRISYTGSKITARYNLIMLPGTMNKLKEF